MWTSAFYSNFCQEFQEFSTMRRVLITTLFPVDKIVEKMWICGKIGDCSVYTTA